jgi:Domain of unknown function (DUF397)
MSDPREWRKSNYSGTGANYVEVCTSEHGTVAVRDSKNVPGPELAVSDQASSEFVQGDQARRF